MKEILLEEGLRNLCAETASYIDFFVKDGNRVSDNRFGKPITELSLAYAIGGEDEFHAHIAKSNNRRLFDLSAFFVGNISYLPTLKAREAKSGPRIELSQTRVGNDLRDVERSGGSDSENFIEVLRRQHQRGTAELIKSRANVGILIVCEYPIWIRPEQLRRRKITQLRQYRFFIYPWDVALTQPYDRITRGRSRDNETLIGWKDGKKSTTIGLGANKLNSYIDPSIVSPIIDPIIIASKEKPDPSVVAARLSSLGRKKSDIVRSSWVKLDNISYDR